MVLSEETGESAVCGNKRRHTLACNARNDRLDAYGDIEQLGLSSAQVVVEVANTFIYLSGKSRLQALWYKENRKLQ